MAVTKLWPIGLIMIASLGAVPPPVEKAELSTANHDPVFDAKSAAASGQFGLFVGGGWHSLLPPGVICFTPFGAAPAARQYVGFGDVVSPDIAARQAYAAAFNRALVDQPDYPDADLCRPRSPEERRERNASNLGVPARAVNRPPHDIFEAARRGTIADLARMLSSQPINGFDSFGMTALGWATARNNAAAFDFLIFKGADPWAAREGYSKSAVYWAAALGRSALFDRLIHRGPRPFPDWPRDFVRASVASGDQKIVKYILAEPHDPYQYVRDLPPVQTMALVLAEAPKSTADDLLIAALDSVDGSDHLDLVRLALRQGADPNAQSSNSPRETALGISAKGWSKVSLDEARLLLAAGADVNRISDDRRPIWHAANTMMLDSRRDEVYDRAKAVFAALVQAGASLKLPNADGRPPIWSILFPLKYDPTKFDPSPITEDLLRFFVADGLDLNAPWNNQRVLTLVERQSGGNSKWVRMLRACGAHD